MNLRTIVVGTIGLSVAGILVSCGGGGGGGSNAPAPEAAAVRSATLNQAQETPAPPVASTAVGRGAVVVNPTTKAITGGVTFTGLTEAPNGAHIHRGDTNIAIALVIASDNATATVPPGTTISDADYAELLAGTLYFNVHTPNNNPNGEIRGNITGTTGVTAGLASVSSAQETTGSTSTATGQGTIVFDSTTGEILVVYLTHDVTNVTAAHIHTGAPGIQGPANVVSLTQGTNIFTGPVTTPRAALTSQQMTDFNAGNTYFNIHSTNLLCPPPAGSCSVGEIRGQIAVQ